MNAKELRDALDVVRGAVAKPSALISTLTHVHLHGARVVAFDGRVTISAPVEHTLSFACPAARLMDAVAALQDDTAVDVRAAGEDAPGRIVVRAGALRVVLPSTPVSESIVQCNIPAWDVVRDAPQGKGTRSKGTRRVGGPGGGGGSSSTPETRLAQGSTGGPAPPVIVQCNKGEGASILATLRALRPFVGEDASRPWSSSVYVHGERCVATNNVTLAEARWPGPRVVAPLALPLFAIDELLRIGREPIAYAIDAQGITFLLPGRVWLRSLLIDATAWPDTNAVLTRAKEAARLQRVPASLPGAVATVRNFCPDPALPLVHVEGTHVRTSRGDVSAEFEVAKSDGIEGRGAFHADPLERVLAVATDVAWAGFPRVAWRGKTAERVELEGVLLGMQIGAARE